MTPADASAITRKFVNQLLIFLRQFVPPKKAWAVTASFRIPADWPAPHPLWIALSSIATCVIVVYCLWATINTLVGMYANIDGYWAAWNLKGILQWSTPLDLSPFNPLAGMGSMFLPNLPWLNPGALPFALPLPHDVQYATSYVIYFFELLITSYILFRAIGATRLHSFIATQVVFLLFFPPFSGFFNSLSWYSLAPVNAHLASMCNLSFVALLQFRAADRYRNIAWGVFLLAAVFVAFLSGPLTVITFIPVYAFFFAFVTLSEPIDWQKFKAQLTAAGVVFAFLLISGVFDYIISSSLVSARSSMYAEFLHPRWQLLTFTYWYELTSAFDACQFGGQALMCPTSDFTKIHIFALLGAFFAVLFSTKFRVLGFAYLGFVAGFHLYALALSDFLLGTMNNINTAFFVWASIPFLALFLSYILILPLQWASARVNVVLSYPLTLLAPLTMAALWYYSIAVTQPGPAPHKQAIGPLAASSIRLPIVRGVVEELRSRAAIRPGSVFQGFAATYFGGPEGWLADEINQPTDFRSGIASRHYLNAKFNNMYQEMDLWSEGIPTFDEYGQWVTKPAFFLMDRLLAEPEHMAHPSFLRVTKLNFPILRMLGVRFIITDAALDIDGVTLLASDTSDTAPGPIRLYEIGEVNLATYSPTEIRIGATIDEKLFLLQQNANELQRLGVASVPPEGPLVAANDPTLTLVKDGWRLRATSSQRSIIAVPFQYTRCWQVYGGNETVRLFRGNALQTFVEFEGTLDIEVQLNFGLIGNSDCRQQDAQDLEDLDFRPISN